MIKINYLYLDIDLESLLRQWNISSESFIQMIKKWRTLLLHSPRKLKNTFKFVHRLKIAVKLKCQRLTSKQTKQNLHRKRNNLLVGSFRENAKPLIGFLCCLQGDYGFTTNPSAEAALA